MDGNRLSEENALTIYECVITMKMEVNPRLNYENPQYSFYHSYQRLLDCNQVYSHNKDHALCYLDSVVKPK